MKTLKTKLLQGGEKPDRSQHRFETFRVFSGVIFQNGDVERVYDLQEGDLCLGPGSGPTNVIDGIGIHHEVRAGEDDDDTGSFFLLDFLSNGLRNSFFNQGF